MGGITRAFQITGQTADLAAARNVAHTTAEAHGIGAYHSFFPAFIAQYYHAVVVASFVESKSAEIYPCAAAYTLVYFKLSDTAVMEYKVFGIAHAVGQALIGNVYSIFSGFRDVGNPLGKGFVFLLFSLCKAGCTVMKRIFSFRVDTLLLCKSRQSSFFPLCFSALYLKIEGVCGVPVVIVVYNDFLFLRVPFARGEYVGSRIFQHRDEVRQDERLCELVFGGTEQARTLPTPFVFVIDVVFSVTLPQSDMASLQSAGYFKRTGRTGHPGSIFIVYIGKQAALVFFSVSVCVGNKFVDGMSVCKDSNVKVSYGTRKNFFDVPVNSVHRFWPEGLVGECIIGIDADCFSVEIDKYTVESACTDIDIDRDIRLEKGLQPFPNGLFYVL